MVIDVIEIFTVQFLIALSVILLAAPIIKAPKIAIYTTLGIVGGARIWVSLLNQKGKDVDWINYIHHGILGDGNIRVMCHKQGLPTIYEATEKGFEKIKYCDENIDPYDYEPISFEYKGYEFYFESGEPYYAEMITPDGDKWECKYDYGYGAGF